MTKKIQEQVAENRNQTRRLDAQFIDVSTQNERNLSFTNNFIEVGVEIEIYSRDLGSSLISGHPGASHGSGRGESGDRRASWTQESVTSSSLLVRGGRRGISNALGGGSGAVSTVGVGTGSDQPNPSDDALTSETNRKIGSGITTGNNVRLQSNPFLFSEYGDFVTEVGSFNQIPRLITRSVLDNPLNLTQEKELRVDLSFTISGDAIGDSVITDVGETALAESLVSGSVGVGIQEINYGTGTTQPADSDTALEAEVISKGVQPIVDSDTATFRSKLFENEPPTQPLDITEIGVSDNNGRLVWRTTINPFEKTDSFEVSTSVGFIVQTK
jgi:hypothetical protein